MKLNDDIELLDGLPIAFIRSINSLVISDLHLGYEGVMAKSGVFAPKVNLKRIIEELTKAIDATKAQDIIVVGDIKSDFSTVMQDEFNELHDLIQFAKGQRVSITLIKGNHDNFVERYNDSFKLKVYNQEALIGFYYFFHGEEVPQIKGKDARMLIMGHEHPCISITNSVGRREKLRCFLHGSYGKLPLLVLPAMNYFSSGTAVNVEPKHNLLAPVLKDGADIDKMHAIAVGFGSTIDFGEIGKLRGL